MINIQIKIIDKRLGTVYPFPKQATDGSAGIDLRACIDKNLILTPGEVKLIPSGIAIYIKEKDYAGIIIPRSGLGHKHGIVLGNLVGLIDSDYQGEIMISCWNRGNIPFTILTGERIAQLIIIPISQSRFTIVNDFTNTSHRNINGFGYTGRK